MRKRLWIALITAVVAVAACGGGGGDGDDDGGDGGSGNGSSGGSDAGAGDNQTPVADAGARQNAVTGTVVRLDGRASRDGDRDPVFYEWTFDSKPPDSDATLSNRNSPVPLFVADADGDYVVRLSANDDTEVSDPDTVTVTAASGNSAPIADAGESFGVRTGSAVTLDGRNSRDANTFGLLYDWTLLSKPDSDVELSGVNTSTPTFTAAVEGRYVVQLVVSDGRAESRPDTVTIRATADNLKPVADAGSDLGVGVGTRVRLDASGSSDRDDEQLSYTWQAISAPQGSGAVLQNTGTAGPSFVADAPGAYVVQVTATDDGGLSDSDRVVITAGPTLKLSADLDNDGSFEDAELPYVKRYGETVVHAPNDDEDDENEGFVLGRFKVTAMNSNLRLNLTADQIVNAAGDIEAQVFDQFQKYRVGDSKQIALPEGETVEFTVNTGFAANTEATLTYGFTVVETGDKFKVTYQVKSQEK